MRLSGTPGSPGRAPPGLAQDRRDILAELGFTDEAAEHLRRTGAAPHP